MPSKAPEASLEKYSVDLDDTTGVHHVVLRKASLRASLALMKSSKHKYSSHFVEFSNGEMKAVPRDESAAITREREIQTTSHREHQQDTQLESVFHHQYADKKPSLAGSLVSMSHDAYSHGTESAPNGPDSAIMGFGPIVGHQAVDEQSSLRTFSESILHIVPRNVTASIRVGADDFDCATQPQESLTTTVGMQTSEICSTSRRSTIRSQDSEVSPSTLPTSPTSSTFSMVPVQKWALEDLPEVPITPRKPTYMTEALALQKVKLDRPTTAMDSDRSALLGLDLQISLRQLIHLDRIENCVSP